MTRTVLHIDSSARVEGSVTRDLSARIVSHLAPSQVISRDLATALPQIDSDWVDANRTQYADRTPEQVQTLSLSDQLIDEIERADTLVIGVPVYNFAPPTSFKAWIDLVCRAGRTFAYTNSGPKGLLRGKRAIFAIASGGVPVASAADFTTPYLHHVMGFIGITAVQMIAADRLSHNPEATLEAARQAVADLKI
ncbi:MAG: FMN-dependent NADH-azoreductase [Sedimentitalea sp.]